jgi:hypothetical protein
MSTGAHDDWFSLKSENVLLRAYLRDITVRFLGLMGMVRKVEIERDELIEEIKQFAQNLGERK